MTPEEMERYIEANKHNVLPPLEENPGKPARSLDELFAAGAITARQYRSILFLLQTGYAASSSVEGVVTDVDRKIEELTRIIEQGDSA